MTEKRFTFTQDTLAKADVFDGNEFVCCTLSVWVEQLVDKLNGLNDENEQLYELIYFANTLIAFKTSESCQKEWKKRLKELTEND